MKRQKRQSFRKRAIGAVIVAACIGLMIVGSKWLEARLYPQHTSDDPDVAVYQDNAISVDGVTYAPRKNLYTVLLMGIDRDSDDAIIGFRSGGQADFLRLLVIDPANRIVSQLAIDRDTMTPITVLSFLGDRQDTQTLQICLSHGYGDGKAQSCGFTVDAVSNLLMGAKVDHYAAVELDGISAINDWAGGVTVTLGDDFSNLDPEMTRGQTITLTGDQAEIFVRERMSVSDGTNANRMARQSVYLNAMADQVGARVKANREEINSLLNVLEPYLVTDMSKGQLINEIWNARDYDILEAVDIPGLHRIGEDGFMEYHVDAQALKDVVLATFYEPI